MKKPRREEIQRILDSAVKRLVENLDVEKIVLFGSFIGGTFTKDSDVDLLIMLNIACGIAYTVFLQNIYP